MCLQGDSGSPLVIGKTVIGIVASAHASCDERHSAALYTRVTSYGPFIKKVIDGTFDLSNTRVGVYVTKKMLGTSISALTIQDLTSLSHTMEKRSKKNFKLYRTPCQDSCISYA